MQPNHTLHPRLPWEVISMIIRLSAWNHWTAARTLSLTCKDILELVRPICWRSTLVRRRVRGKNPNHIITWFSSQQHLIPHVKRLEIDCDKIDIREERELAHITLLLPNVRDYLLLHFDFSSSTRFLRYLGNATHLRLDHPKLRQKHLKLILAKTPRLQELTINGGIFPLQERLATTPLDRYSNRHIQSSIKALIFVSCRPYTESTLPAINFFGNCLSPDCLPQLTTLKIRLPPEESMQLPCLFKNLGEKFLNLRWSIPCGTCTF